MDETEVGIDLYSALVQFFTVYSEYVASDLYVTGEVGECVVCVYECMCGYIIGECVCLNE